MLNAVDPDGEPVKFELWSPRQVWAVRMGVGAVYELRDCVMAVLLGPSAIYRGLRCDEDEPRASDLAPGWVCYCGRPPCRYDLPSGREIGMAGRVLLVFVNEDRIVYHHHWYESSDEITPCDADGRFREKLL